MLCWNRKNLKSAWLVASKKTNKELFFQVKPGNVNLKQ